MIFTNLSRTLVLFCLSTCFAAFASGDDLGLAQQIQKQYQELWNRHNGSVLELTASYETKSREGRKSVTTQKAELLSIREVFGDRFVVDFRPRISKWNSGAREYYLTHETIGFDGTRSFSSTLKEGGYPDARIHQTREILLKKSVPEFTTIQYDNGLGAFLAFQSFFGKESVFESKFFEEDGAGAKYEVSATQVDNFVQIDLLEGDPEATYGRYTLNLDSEKGFALVSMMHILVARRGERNPYTNFIECSEFTEMAGADGLFFPRSCKFRISAKTVNITTELKIESAEIRKPEFGEFEIAYPAGWRIRDEATGRDWIVGE